MTQWSTTTKHEPESINNGRKYELRDRVSIEQLNNMTENAFYAMQASSEAKEKAEEALSFAQGSGTTVFENGSPVAEFNADKKANKTDLNEFYTKQEVDDKISNLDVDVDFSDYYNKTETDTLTSQALNSAKSYTDTKVADLIDSAPETLDTFKEIADAFAEDQEVLDTLNAAIGNKADKSELSNYVTNTALEGKGYLTEVPSEYVTETELANKGYATTSALNSGLARKADQSALNNCVKYDDIEDGTGSTSTRKALSANQGRILNNYIQQMWAKLPDEYIKKATVSDNLLILTNQDDENTTFGGGSSLSAEPVAIGTTRTGQNDTVVEYYVSGDGNTAYRKYASGWKEYYTIHNITVQGVADVRLPDGFFSKILNVEVLPHSGTENTTLYISKYYVTSTLSNIRFANVYYASSSNAGYNTGKAFVKVVGY